MKYRSIAYCSAIFMTLVLSSCKKFIQIDPPKNSLVPATVFKSNDLAVSAMLGIYQQMAANGYASGDASSIATLCATVTDEFTGYGNTLLPIYDNKVTPETAMVGSIWTNMYNKIYGSNALLEGLANSTAITPDINARLQGEALFTRAFHYFYLVNLFGPLPLQLSTNYESNRLRTRSSVAEIYDQIIKDLLAAELLLARQNNTLERVLPTKAAVQALLAKTYLHTGDWPNAEKYATAVITDNGTYRLTALNDVFLKNSQETIWQLMPPAGTNTPAAALLVLTTAPATVSLRKDFAEKQFEPNDLRKPAWVKSITVAGTTYYYPFKYKVKSSTTVTEYTMMFRLAEQYLIRAEARAKQDKLTGAIDDLDMIRHRAGLPLIKNTTPGITGSDLLKAIQKERRIELFAEGGSRWLDLKRNNQLTAVLTPLKPNWMADYELFPIPQAEINNNHNIKQNEGYE